MIKKPFIAVNHLEGHALSPRINSELNYPYLFLLISGGHSQFLNVKGLGNYKRLGTTIDDALGEAFDKTAKLLGIEFPGGPKIEVFADKGNPEKYDLPKPIINRGGCNLSFAGLKTAVLKISKNIKTEQPHLKYMIKLDERSKKQLVKLYKEKNITIEGNILKLLDYKDDEEFESYIKESIAKDKENRRRRLDLTKKIQKQNTDLLKSQEEYKKIQDELSRSLDETKLSRDE